MGRRARAVVQSQHGACSRARGALRRVGAKSSTSVERGARRRHARRQRHAGRAARRRRSPWRSSALPPGAAVFDLVYRAGETAWVRAAREAGHRAADGEGMLVEQGALVVRALVRHRARPRRDVERAAALSAALARAASARCSTCCSRAACAVCERARAGHERELVCGACWLRAHELPRPRCDRCGHPVDLARPTAPCVWCALLPPYVRAVRSAYAMPGGAAESIVHALKYDGWHARRARRWRAAWPRCAFPPTSSASAPRSCPCRSRASRRRERGYNQSEVLADGARAPLEPSRCARIFLHGRVQRRRRRG